MFQRPRVFADPFGSFLEGKRKREKDDIAFAEFVRGDETAALNNEARALQNDLDSTFGFGDRQQAQEIRDIGIDASLFELQQNEQFATQERDTALTGRRLNNDIAAFELELNREFGFGDRQTASRDASEILRGRRLDNNITEQFGERRTEADINAANALAGQRERTPADRNNISPATQALLNTISGRSDSTQQAPQQGQVNNPLFSLEQSLNLGATIPDDTLSGLLDLYLQQVDQDPSTVQRTQEQFPQLFDLLTQAQN